MDLTVYDTFYHEFCELLPPAPAARVLDAACGPGNVARYLLKRRPDLELYGIDLAPRMVELARQAVPSGRFAVDDCRKLAELKQTFDGIVFAFGLPYLSPPEAGHFIEAAWQALEPQGVLYLSTMLGKSEDSGFEQCSTGDQVYVNYHGEDQVLAFLRNCGFTVVTRQRIQSPTGAPKPTTDLIVIATKMDQEGGDRDGRGKQRPGRGKDQPGTGGQTAR